MIAPMEDSYWWQDALAAIENIQEVPRSAFDGLSQADSTVRQLAIRVLTLGLTLALERHSREGAHAAGGRPAIPPSVIARGAVVALIASAESELAPPSELFNLLAKLLAVEGLTRGSSHAARSETYAVLLIRLIPGITPAELADEAEITKSTASRWLNDPQILEWANLMTVHEAEGILSKAEADEVRSRIEGRRQLLRRGRPRKQRKIRPRREV